MKMPGMVAVALLLPSVVAAQNLSRDELLQLAVDRGTCGDLVPVDAWYETEGGTTIRVRCGEATGFVPVAGALGLGTGAAAAAAGLALVGAAGGGGGSTPSTN